MSTTQGMVQEMQEATGSRLQRVTHVVTGLEIGGAERALVKLVESTRHNFVHSVVSLQSGGALVRSLRELDAAVYELGMRAGRVPSRGILTLVKTLSVLRPDIIQGWMYHGNIAALVGAKLARQSGPIIWSIHGLLHESDTSSPLTKGLIWLGARASTSPRKIIYKSPESQRDHEAVGYSRKKSVLMPNGFDTVAFAPDEQKRRAFRTALDVSADQILVGVVARMHPVKDHLNFIQAAHIVRSRNPAVRFAVIGRSAEKIREAAGPLGLQSTQLGDRLIALPEQGDVASAMNALDIHVVSSASESFPNVLGEAMACGVPSVSTDVGACREVLGESGLIVPSKNSAQLADAILRLVDSPELRARMGAAGRQRVVQNYSMAAVSQRYTDIWNAEMAQQSRADRAAC